MPAILFTLNVYKRNKLLYYLSINQWRLNMEKFYRTYITRFETNSGIKYYGGKHESSYRDPLHDPYYGSGLVLQRAVKKYGLNCIKSIVWNDHQSENDMNLSEIELISTLIEKYQTDCVNIAAGGTCGNTLRHASPEKIENYKRKLSLANLGKVVPVETRNKIANTMNSDNVREQMSLSMKGKNLGKKLPERTREHCENISIANTGKIHLEETKAKISNSVKLAGRKAPVWQLPLYQVLWDEWNKIFDTTGNKFKCGKFAKHVTNCGIYECTANNLSGLISHFNKVIDGDEELFHKIKGA